MEKICEKCGDIFPRKDNVSNSSWKKRRYCSLKCFHNTPRSAEYRNNISKGQLGKIQSESTKRKIIKAKTERPTRYWLGKQFSKEMKKKLSESHIGKYNNEKHPGWKGDDAGCTAIHSWVRRKLGTPSKCEFCGSEDEKRYEWANKDHKYSRNLADYTRLCKSCHAHYDIKIRRLNINRRSL